MEEKPVVKKRVEKPEIELHCECDGIAFSTLWSPGYPWRIEASGQNIDEKKTFGDMLQVFNSAKQKFDRIIRRLEREYKQFDEVIQELPEAE